MHPEPTLGRWLRAGGGGGLTCGTAASSWSCEWPTSTGAAARRPRQGVHLALPRVARREVDRALAINRPADPGLPARAAWLPSIPGGGRVATATVLAAVPDLGSCVCQHVAALVGGGRRHCDSAVSAGRSTAEASEAGANGTATTFATVVYYLHPEVIGHRLFVQTRIGQA
ncbi:MAG: hypothetical protein OXG64_06400 [Chloroflexi bacterium]|nr:hypothetical protein [Chloroflexota bacterium]